MPDGHRVLKALMNVVLLVPRTACRLTMSCFWPQHAPERGQLDHHPLLEMV